MTAAARPTEVCIETDRRFALHGLVDDVSFGRSSDVEK
jgi:hypothetical protein